MQNLSKNAALYSGSRVTTALGGSQSTAPFQTFSNLREDDETGEILLDLHDSAKQTLGLRLERGVAGLLGTSIISALQASSRSAPDSGTTQIPAAINARTVVSGEGWPCLGIRVNENIPIVLEISRGMVERLRLALHDIERFYEMANPSKPAH
jgi:hypothetical protein